MTSVKHRFSALLVSAYATCLCGSSSARNPAESPSIPITVLKRGGFEGVSAVTVGVPFPDNAVSSADDLVLLDAGGRPQPLQSRVTATWTKGGAAKWILLDFQSALPAETNQFRLHYGNDSPTAPGTSPLIVEESASDYRVQTGPLSFVVLRAGFDLIHSAAVDANKDGQWSPAEQIVERSADRGPYLTDAHGKIFRTANDKQSVVTLEEAGPMRLCLKARAWYVADDGEKLCQAVVRIHAYRGKPYVRVFHTLIFTADSTKVQLSDIGIACPMAAGSAGMGSDKPVKGSNLRLVQYEHDKHKVFSGGTMVAEGGSAPGWVQASGARGGVTVAVRDFWQMYPKEMEASANGVVVHLWPAHNEVSPAPQYSMQNVGSLWFIHHGKLLDFRVPNEMSGFTPPDKGESAARYLRASGETNGMGTARTHELVFWFQPPGEPSVEGDRVQALAQQPPLAVTDPKWVAASDAFGPIHPYDPDRFPETERALSLMFDYERSMEDFNQDYGWFCLGNGHSYWKYGDKRYDQTERPWRNMHHGACRAPWLLYARSGDPKYLDYARRNTLFNLDVGICHFSTPEFENEETLARRKIKGALTDYKGIVPWSAGYRLADYNAMTDFMLYDYYLTGNGYALDVALEWGEAMKRLIPKPGAYGGRGWAGPCAALVALYEATWDETYKKMAVDHVDRLAAAQKPDGSFDGWTNYAPWLSSYYRLTHDPAVAQIAVRWSESAARLSASSAINGDATNGFDGYGRQDGYALYDVQAVAFAATGNRDILADALGKLLLISNSVLDKPGSFAHGADLFSSSSTGTYFAQTVPYIMRPLADQRGKIEPSFPRWSARFPLEATLLDVEDQELTFTFGRNADVALEVLAPDGTKVLEKSFSGAAAEESFTLPADGKRGLYRISMKEPKGKDDILLPIRSNRPVKMVYRMPSAAANFSRDCAVYFRVPKDTQTVDIEMSGRANLAFTTALYAPLGGRLGVKNWYAVEEPGAVHLRVPLGPEQQGQVLCFLQGASKSLTLNFMSPKPEYFSDRPERFFEPVANAN